MLCKKPRQKTRKIFIPQPRHTTVQKETEENENKENIFIGNNNSKKIIFEKEDYSKNRLNTSKNCFTGRNSFKVKLNFF